MNVNMNVVKDNLLKWLSETSFSDMQKEYDSTVKNIIAYNSSLDRKELNNLISNYKTLMLDKEFYTFKVDKFTSLIKNLDIEHLKQSSSKRIINIINNNSDIINIMKKCFKEYPIQTKLIKFLDKENFLNINLLEEMKNYSTGELYLDRENIVNYLTKKMSEVLKYYDILDYTKSIDFINKASYMDMKSNNKLKTIESVLEREICLHLSSITLEKDVGEEKTTFLIKKLLNSFSNLSWEDRANIYITKNLFLNSSVENITYLMKECNDICASIRKNIEEYTQDELISVVKMLREVQNLYSSKHDFIKEKFVLFENIHNKLYGKIEENEYLKLMNDFIYFTDNDDKLSPNNSFHLSYYLINRNILMNYDGKDTLDAYEVEKLFTFKVTVPEIICLKDFKNINKLNANYCKIKLTGTVITIEINSNFELNLPVKEILSDLNDMMDSINKLKYENWKITQESLEFEQDKMFDSILRKWKMQQELSDKTENKKRKKI